MVMVDIETLGTADDAVILEVGAVCFGPNGVMGPIFSVVVDFLGQPTRRIEGETLGWWMRPEHRAGLERLLGGGEDPEEQVDLWHALNELAAFMRDNLEVDGEIWAKGDFDTRILSHAFKAEGVDVPWEYWQVRELRSVLKFCGVTRPREATAHRALVDAMAQVQQYAEARTRVRDDNAGSDAPGAVETP